MQMPRTRLIDCKARKLINVGVWPFHMPRFAALSYRWGVTPEPQMEQDREDRSKREGSLSNLPLTIEDAISVTKGLGLRYLWVDQYCIDQNNSQEKQAQIQNMDRIYQCAEVAIMAPAGEDCHYGLPGVSKRARRVLDPLILDDTLTFGICPAAGAHWQNGAWHERGWTFQKTHLPRRRLVFSDTLVHFECAHHRPWQRENGGGFETVQHNAKVARKLKGSYNAMLLDPFRALDTVTAYAHRGNFEACIVEYYSFVLYYTTRKLSYASDSLNAFLGLANAMQEFRHPIYNVAGVPFMVGNEPIDRDYWAESSFSSGLAWFSIQGTDRSDQQDAVNGKFPSWSWGNTKLWPVQLKYLDHLEMLRPEILRPDALTPPRKESKERAIKHKARLRDIQVEFTSDGNKQVTGLAEYADKSRKALKMSLPQPTALLFKARFVPSHAITLHSEDENIDEDDDTIFSGEFCHNAHGRREHFKIGLVDDTSDETNRYPQADLQDPWWDSRRYRLIVHDREFHRDMIASGWSLLLLRCFDTPRSVRLLVVKGVEENTASRVGTSRVRPRPRLYGADAVVAGWFLRCFTDEREVRLV
ncbi:hypothetical protein N8I77_003007 [Diaporthe amygdali]|uniref:Heterokaryon incompatibility domain-containing protein n=1 Tax=Phomopsis amygdali TaxID=1214568 RepID=A0AAD9SH49_PHOAM|nr:hypothetical protein N8I77_003007 [Diaporthe amygdali]